MRIYQAVGMELIGCCYGDNGVAMEIQGVAMEIQGVGVEIG